MLEWSTIRVKGGAYAPHHQRTMETQSLVCAVVCGNHAGVDGGAGHCRRSVHGSLYGDHGTGVSRNYPGYDAAPPRGRRRRKTSVAHEQVYRLTDYAVKKPVKNKT